MAWVTFAATAGTAPSALGEVVYSGIVNLPIPSTESGIYLNVVTRASESPGDGGVSSIADWDVRMGSGSGLYFHSPPSGIGSAYMRVSSTDAINNGVSNLDPGTLIGPAEAWRSGWAQTYGAAPFTANASTNLVGFRFTNEATGQLHYGWMRVSLAATLGSQPRTIVEYAYESSPGVPIMAGDVGSGTDCPLDLSGDGRVDGADFGELLAMWGQPGPTDLNFSGVTDGQDLAILLSSWGDCPAVVTGVNPDRDSLSGGTLVTITGRRLQSVKAVTIGGVAATRIVVVDSNTIQAVTPPSKAIGPRELIVTTAAGSATLRGSFIYYNDAAWATVIEDMPDPEVVTDPELFDAIVATGLPWRVRDNDTQIEMLLVPPGTFMMGCSPSLIYPCRANEEPVHEVVLTEPFYLGRYEVTQSQWVAVMGSNPSHFRFPGSELLPVENVTWYAAQNFNAAASFRLPTEAEWEYAGRAGAPTAFHNGSDDDWSLVDLGWIAWNATAPRPGGLKLANALGFHDMHGNVSEWVSDWFAEAFYSHSPGIDPAGPESGTRKAFRGGAWYWHSDFSRLSNRYGLVPTYAAFSRGFRVARTP